MKKLIGTIAIAICLVGAGFAESLRFTTKTRGFQNGTANYVESNPDKDIFEKFYSYAKYVGTNDIIYFYFTDEQGDWYKEKLDGSQSGSWLRYFDKAWDKFIYARDAFSQEFLSKNDEKKADKILDDSKSSIIYIRHIFNAGEVFCDGESNAACIQWEMFIYTDESNKDHFLYVWQGSKNNDPKDFVTYID